jgi:hypothetical protein
MVLTAMAVENVVVKGSQEEMWSGRIDAAGRSRVAP